jgi:uncharacterized protein YkwD
VASSLGFLTAPPSNASAQGYICDAPDVWVDPQEARLFDLVNGYRLSYGIEPLAWSETLISSAGWMAGDLGWRNYFAHTDVFGRGVGARQNDCGNWGGWKGENIAGGTNIDNADAVFGLWLNSPSHNQQMLDPNMRFAGVSRYYAPNSTLTWYWVMDFSSDW